MPLVNSRPNPLKGALALLCYLLALGIIAVGLQYVTGSAHPEGGVVNKVVGDLTGRAHPDGGIVYRVGGVIMVVAGIAVFGTTVRRWSKYFFGFCLLLAIKALFALFVGHTMQRLTVSRMYALEYFGLLVAMVFLSWPYSDRSPRTALESISLVSAVVALAAGIAFEPYIWPVVGGVVLLALPLLLGRLNSRSRIGESLP